MGRKIWFLILLNFFIEFYSIKCSDGKNVKFLKFIKFKLINNFIFLKRKLTNISLKIVALDTTKRQMIRILMIQAELCLQEI